MKKYLLIIAIASCVSLNTFAQPKPVEVRAKQATEKLSKDLSLTEDQKLKVTAANIEKIKATDALKEEAGEGNKPDANKVKVIDNNFNKVLSTTLNADQIAKMQTMRAQKATDKMAMELSLTEDQKAKIQVANIEKVKATDILTLATDHGKPDANKMKVVYKNFNDVVNATLTAEQLQLMKDNKAKQAVAKAE